MSDEMTSRLDHWGARSRSNDADPSFAQRVAEEADRLHRKRVRRAGGAIVAIALALVALPLAFSGRPAPTDQAPRAAQQVDEAPTLANLLARNDSPSRVLEGDLWLGDASVSWTSRAPALGP